MVSADSATGFALDSLKRLIRWLFVVVVVLEVVVSMLVEPGRGYSMLWALTSLDRSAVGALALGGSAWLVLAIAKLWPPAFLRLSAGLFVVGLALAFAIKALYAPDMLRTNVAVIGMALTIPSTLAFAYASWAALRGLSTHGPVNLFWHLTAFFVLMGIFTIDGLNIGLALLPRTYDGMAYHVDSVFGPSLAVTFGQVLQDQPFVKSATQVVYDLIGYVAVVFTGLVLRAGKAVPMRLWQFAFWPYAIGGLLYLWLPITGPAYAFPNLFPNAMPEATSLPLASMIGPLAYRNGMPSMHLTGALLLLYAALCIRNRPVALGSMLFVLLTAWATLSLGEHYAIDLVVALPFSAALAAVLLSPASLRSVARYRNMTAASAMVTALWLVGLRLAPAAFVRYPLLTIAFAFLSAVLALLTVRHIVNRVREINDAFDRHSLPEQSVTNERTFAPVAQRLKSHWPTAIFFLSGLAGLMYEVVFSKALALSFGSTALANYTVLATYMGGMAVGSWVGGRWAAATSNPLRGYAICELLIGAYAAVTPVLFSAMQAAYVTLSAGHAPDASILTPLRVALGAITLGVPTVLMGATFPLMLKYVRGHAASSEQSIAALYGSNVIGAAIGSFLGGYLLLPLAGKAGATLFAAALSLVAALLALRRSKDLTSASPPQPAVTGPSSTIGSTSVATALDTKCRTRGRVIVAAVVLGVGGALTLALEVVYIHLLAVVAGNSVYAFSLMLAAFLSGLGIGAEICRRWLSGKLPSILVLVVAELGLAVAIAATAHIWDGIPVYFGSFGAYMPDIGFAGREVIRALVCFVAMLPSAAFIGMAYPAAMDILSQSADRDINRGVGVAAMLNTTGNILGVFVGGFLLLPTFGSLMTVRILAYAAFAIACLAIVVATARLAAATRVRAYIAASIVALVLLLQPKSFDYEDLTNGANVYFTPQSWGKHIEHIESVSGGLTSVATVDSKVFTLLTNGKFQGNNAEGGEMVAQVGFAIAPLLHTAMRERALVIGYGTGVTSRVLQEAGFETLDVAEIASDVVTLADKYFSNVNGKVLYRPGVNLYVTDGRNFLLTQDRTYDLISMEISSIWFAGAANLYNREFYQLAKRRLRAQGVLQQWVQLHHIRAVDVAYVLGSVRSEFKYVWLYVIGGQGIIVATNSEQSSRRPENAQKLLSAEALKPLLALYRNHPEDAARGLALGPADIERLIAKYDVSMERMVSTDNNLYLEYSTPKGNAIRTGGLAEGNINTLRREAGLATNNADLDGANAKP